jgi:tRNA pseudouridine55 synthase
MKFSPFHGLLVLDKPGGMTSRDVVNRVQTWFPRGTRIGHTGTLDPLATGVLVVCVGVATRLAEYIQDMDKTYRAGIQLGAVSDTDDADGVITHYRWESPWPDEGHIRRCIQGFVGEIEQVPPAYSAAKVMGRRAYNLARGGKPAALEPRRVRIYDIEVLAIEPLLDLRVHCGKGTYIRSLARDLGRLLGCGAYVKSLRRTRVGPFEAANALRLENDGRTAQACLLPLSAAVAGLPRVTLEAEEIGRLRQGQGIGLANWVQPDAAMDDQVEVAVFDPAGALVAVGEVSRATNWLRPGKVLPENRLRG